MQGLLLDTCAVIWLGLGHKMKQSSLDAITESAANDSVWISPFSAWELSLLAARNRVALGMNTDDWFNAFLQRDGLSLASLPVSVLVAAHQLPGDPPNDPADRILLATARSQNLAIVTRDRRILDYGASGRVRTIAC